MLIILEDPGLPELCAPVFKFGEAMEFAETGYRRKERPGLPVSLLMVLPALQLECENSMELIASSHRSCFFCSNRESRNEAALSKSVPSGARMKER